MPLDLSHSLRVPGHGLIQEHVMSLQRSKASPVSPMGVHGRGAIRSRDASFGRKILSAMGAKSYRRGVNTLIRLLMGER